MQRINEHLANPSQIGVVGLAVTYTALVILVRWQVIARPIRNAITARLHLLEVEAHRAGKSTSPSRRRCLI